MSFYTKFTFLCPRCGGSTIGLGTPGYEIMPVCTIQRSEYGIFTPGELSPSSTRFVEDPEAYDIQRRALCCATCSYHLPGWNKTIEAGHIVVGDEDLRTMPVVSLAERLIHIRNTCEDEQILLCVDNTRHTARNTSCWADDLLSFPGQFILKSDAGAVFDITETLAPHRENLLAEFHFKPKLGAASGFRIIVEPLE